MGRGRQRRLAWLGALGLGVLGEAQAICPAPTTGREVQEAALAAEDAFVRIDPAAFEGAVSQMRAALVCLSEPISPEAAASLHNTEALAAFLARDEGATVASFRAALQAAPTVDLGAALEPTHPIRYERRYAGRFEAPAAVALRPLSDSEQALADGHLLNQRPQDVPVILQRMYDDTVLANLYLPLGGPLPDWIEEAPPPLSPLLKRRLRLSGLALATVATTGVMVRSAALSRTLYLDPGTAYTRLDTLERRANLYSSLSLGGAVLSVGVGTFVVLTW